MGLFYKIYKKKNSNEEQEVVVVLKSSMAEENVQTCGEMARKVWVKLCLVGYVLCFMFCDMIFFSLSLSLSLDPFSLNK